MPDRLDLEDRWDIVETCLQWTSLIDNRRWDDLADIFADTIDFDYTSIFGGEPASTTRAELVRTSRMLLGNLSATQHLVSGHIVTGSGDQAHCVSQVQAAHIKHNDTGDSHWTVGAQYDMTLVRVERRWQICAIHVTARWFSGNREVMRLGKVRSPVADRPAG